MTRVLVVDHPHYAAELGAIIRSAAGFELVGQAATAEQALQLAQRQRPEVLAVGLHATAKAALDAIAQVMQHHPVPVVVVAAADGTEAEASFRALEAGALTVVEWPRQPSAAQRQRTVQTLLDTLRTMAEVRVVRRWGQQRPPSRVAERGKPRPRLVLIGGSTGAPTALKEILAELPDAFPLPIVVVQHMSAGFLPAFAQWLQNASGFPVTIARDGEPLRPGQAYLAPDGRQLGIASDFSMRLRNLEAEHGMCPSVSHLFRSVPPALRRSTAAVLLTGMGRDGARELRELKDGGALTLVQDRDTSAVYGMPGEAVRQDAAMLILAPREIGRVLSSYANGVLGPFGPKNNEGDHEQK